MLTHKNHYATLVVNAVTEPTKPTSIRAELVLASLVTGLYSVSSKNCTAKQYESELAQLEKLNWPVDTIDGIDFADIVTAYPWVDNYIKSINTPLKYNGLTEARIYQAMAECNYIHGGSKNYIPVHENTDCIRIAYHWLDAQIIRTNKIKIPRPIKSMIERWAQRYVSSADVEVAAFLHPEIHGSYPLFNISSKMAMPHPSRLEGIGEAYKHKQYAERFSPLDYYTNEESFRGGNHE